MGRSNKLNGDQKKLIESIVREARQLQGDSSFEPTQHAVVRSKEKFILLKQHRKIANLILAEEPSLAGICRGEVSSYVKLIDDFIEAESRKTLSLDEEPTLRDLIMERARELLVPNASPAAVTQDIHYELMEQSGITTEKIRTCVAKVQDERMQEARDSLVNEIEYDGTSTLENVIATLSNLIGATLAQPEQALLISTALAHWMVNVKKKLGGRCEETEMHIVPVFLGREHGTGKSQFVRNFCSPFLSKALLGLSRTATLEQVTDERQWISLAKCPVVFLDEMAKGARSDQEVLKMFVTEPTLTTRVFHTQKDHTFRNQCSMIGTANADSIAELIPDSTGNRRFLGIQIDTFFGHVEKSFDGAKYWRMVDANWNVQLPQELRAMQAEQKALSTVENFISAAALVADANGCWLSSGELYVACCKFAQTVGQPKPKNIKCFSVEFARVIGAKSERGGGRQCHMGFKIKFDRSALAGYMVIPLEFSPSMLPIGNENASGLVSG